ncbi:hypothetical protein UFOVP806_52 [uncultured Caudovirales phage]|uniref:Uncharacterized protein n=1 Tax=uncultured Caudovirales phage TaxID=2100421 RepID=A0A6J5P348_9CAUD|nr:hypothetical protein UFOVP806_52 [uncultured Caudovirales phage]
MASKMAITYTNDLSERDRTVIPWHELRTHEQGHCHEAMKSALEKVISAELPNGFPTRAHLRSHLSIQGIGSHTPHLVGFNDLYEDVKFNASILIKTMEAMEESIDNLKTDVDKADARIAELEGGFDDEACRWHPAFLAAASVISRIASVCGMTWGTYNELVEKIVAGKAYGEKMKAEVERLNELNEAQAKDIGNLRGANTKLVADAASNKAKAQEILREFGIDCPTDDIADMVRAACECVESRDWQESQEESMPTSINEWHSEVGFIHPARASVGYVTTAAQQSVPADAQPIRYKTSSEFQWPWQGLLTFALLWSTGVLTSILIGKWIGW